MIASDRKAAGMPGVSPEMLSEGLRELAEHHATTLSDAAATMPDGAELLVAMLREAGRTVSPKTLFLRQCAAAWDRCTTGAVERDIEAAATMAERLVSDARWDDAQALSATIGRIAGRTGPQRAAAELVGLTDDRTTNLVRGWRDLAQGIRHLQEAVAEASALLEAVAKGFSPSDDLGASVRRELAACAEAIAAGDAVPEVRRLRRAIIEAFDHPEVFEDWKASSNEPVVKELRDSFSAASLVASPRPWDLLRRLTLKLQNEHTATAAALALTEDAIAKARSNPAAAEFEVLFAKDRDVLLSDLLQAEAVTAVKAGRRRDALRVLDRLATLNLEPKLRAELRSLASKLRLQVAKQVATWIFWLGAIGVGIVAISLNDTSRPGRDSRPATVAAVPGAVADPGTEVRPQPGGGVLSIAGLRYCRFQKARADGAFEYLTAIQAAPGTDPDGFAAAASAYNSMIEPMNASCASYQFERTDSAVIEAEIARKGTSLATEGRVRVAQVYDAAIARSRPTPSPMAPVYVNPQPPAARSAAAQPAPQPYQPPAAPFLPSFAVPYMQGQSDRRALDAWVGSLSPGMREGADWWASVRSAARPPTCAAVPRGLDPAAAIAGCREAQLRLGEVDKRRRSEPDYRSGWNNP